MNPLKFAANILGRFAACPLPQTGPTGDGNMTNVAELLRPDNATGPRYGGVIDLSVDSWVSVPDNPRQRDTEGRAKRAKHLRALHPTHCLVNMARLPDGGCYKLDGHTRAYLWKDGSLERPAKVFATLWQCNSVEEVKGLYGTFDSKEAVEGAVDRVFGAMREHDLAFESELLATKRIVSGMRTATELLFGNGPSKSVYEMVDYWLPELNLLDQCRPTRHRFHAGVMAASLLTLRRYGPSAIGFWRNFAMGAGTKISGERDAVQALEERMESLRLHKKLSGRGNYSQIVRICLSAFDAYQRDFSYSTDSSGIKALGDNSFERFIVATAKTARRW